MNKVNRYIIVMIIWSAVLLQGCSIIPGNRTGDDWLRLVHAGMIAEDDFRFDGSVAMGFTDGMALTPYSFEGEIQRHKQIALYVKEKNSLVRNPVNDLDFIAMNYSNVDIVYEGLAKDQDISIVVIQVTADEEAATRRWKDQLEQELSSVTMQAIGASEEAGGNVRLVKQQSSAAETSLAEMLKELKVTMTYTITIDKLKAKPLKMEEYTNLQYKKNGSLLNEYRKTNVKFDLSGVRSDQS